MRMLDAPLGYRDTIGFFQPDEVTEINADEAFRGILQRQIDGEISNEEMCDLCEHSSELAAALERHVRELAGLPPISGIITPPEPDSIPE